MTRRFLVINILKRLPNNTAGVIYYAAFQAQMIKHHGVRDCGLEGVEKELHSLQKEGRVRSWNTQKGVRWELIQ
jgi:hypothetical protein